MDLAHLVETRDIQDVYVQRYRADYVARALWRLSQGRAHWHRMPMTPGSVGSSGFSVRGGGTVTGVRYLPITVPPCAVLHLDDQRLRLWASDYRQSLCGLTTDERDAWEDYLLKPRLSSVFYLVRRWAMVRRSDNASEDLARAALKLVGDVEVAGNA